MFFIAEYGPSGYVNPPILLPPSAIAVLGNCTAAIECHLVHETVDLLKTR